MLKHKLDCKQVIHAEKVSYFKNWVSDIGSE